MKFGLLLTSVHDRTVPASQQIAEHRELIAAAEQLGFDLVVAGQHFGTPTLRYLQPVPYLASIAAQFPSMRVATGIILLPLTHPLRVAEEMATLDAITDGRTIVGLGIGYAQAEFDAFGIDRATRTARFEEAIDVIRALWTGEPVTHHGQFFDLDEVATSTLPVQSPPPPIWIGAQAEASVRRAGRLADAWYVPPFPTHRELLELYEIYLEERDVAGRAGGTAIPVRRELYLADTMAEAEAAVTAGASSRYGTYAAWGLDLDSGLGRDQWLDNRFLLGDGATVAESIDFLAATVEHSEFVYKPQWPGQTHAHAMNQLERFGTEVIPLLDDAKTQPLEEGSDGDGP
jgi:alkanesulfonate monooxygenase SsuD/methylene tetrahydromethanopterin reductase-like flavin-dependent oxidoreductase (luciferase family)